MLGRPNWRGRLDWSALDRIRDLHLVLLRGVDVDGQAGGHGRRSLDGDGGATFGARKIHNDRLGQPTIGVERRCLLQC